MLAFLAGHEMDETKADQFWGTPEIHQREEQQVTVESWPPVLKMGDRRPRTDRLLRLL